MIMVLVASCKQSDKYSTDNLYPIPDYPKYAATSLAASEQVQDASLKPYFDEFYTLKASHALANDKTVYYKFKDLTVYGSVLGRCETYDNANVVYIDPVFFAGAVAMDIRSVVFHEMGHCDLSRNHRTLYWQGTAASYDGGIIPSWGNELMRLSDGVTLNPNYRGNWPLSLMHRSIVRTARFTPEYDWYIHELFSEGLYVNGNFAPGNSENNCTAHYELDGNIHYE